MAYDRQESLVKAHAAVNESGNLIDVSFEVPERWYGVNSTSVHSFYLFRDKARTLRDELTAALEAMDEKEKHDAGQ